MIASESRAATLDLQRAKGAVDIRVIESDRARTLNSSVNSESFQ